MFYYFKGHIESSEEVTQRSGDVCKQCDNSVTVSCTDQPPQSSCPPDDIALSPSVHPVQPVNVTYPVTLFSGKARSFNPTWFRAFRWLEYSVKTDVCYCFPCRLFGSNSGGSKSRPVQVFTVTGFRSWKHATGMKGSLTVHDSSSAHQQAVVAWEMYNVTAKSNTTVIDQLGNAREELMRKNRHYIKSIAEVLLLCSRQDIPLRGHRESPESANRGNFLEILLLVASHSQK